MGKKTDRKSNFELLRIVAMVMIIAHHIVVHCVEGQLTGPQYIEQFGTGYFNQPAFYSKLFFLVSGVTFGKIGNGIFILISGYFLVSKESIDLGKSGKKLLEQLFFSGIVLVGLSYIVRIVLEKKEHYIPLQNIQTINTMSWFVGYYFLIILIAAVFLNKRLANMEKGLYEKVLIVIFAITQFSWSGAVLDSLAADLRTLLLGVFLYALGGYLRKYRPFQNVKTYVFPLAILASYIIMFFSYHNDVVNSIQVNGQNTTFVQEISWYTNYHPLIIVVVVCMFEIFNRIRIASNKVINFISGSTFMIYLLHDNEFCYAIWDMQDWITVLWNSPMKFVGKVALWSFWTFLYGFVFYCLYIICRKIFYRLKPLIFVKKKM